jgi:hypothetical protein
VLAIYRRRSLKSAPHGFGVVLLPHPRVRLSCVETNENTTRRGEPKIKIKPRTQTQDCPPNRGNPTTIKVTIAPHTVLPWHTHPVPNSVYVLSGTPRCGTEIAAKRWWFIRVKPPGNP